MTQIAQQVEIAMLNTINVIYGQHAARIHHVLMGREIVIITQIVKEHFSVAMTIVQVDQQEWTAAQMMVIEIFVFTCGEAMQVYKSSFSSFSFSSILQKMSLRSNITIKDTIVDILHHDSDQCDHL